MPIPLLDLNAQNLPLEAELTAAFHRVLRSGQFIMGPDVPALETEIAQMVGVKHAIGVSSGTDAILLALMTLGLGPGDEVLCPTFTFFATAGCIARVGATPVFVDADPVTFNLDVRDAARKVTPRTKAIIPVHLFGQCADMDPVMDLARAHKLSVIEDAAQSLGATYKGRGAGTIGDFGTYSFFPSKNLGALGDAGMLVTNNDDLAEKARLLRTHGAQPKYYHRHIGGNFRLDSLQAAFLRVKLPHYKTYTAKRQANAAYYTEKLSKLPGVILASDYSARLSHANNQSSIINNQSNIAPSASSVVPGTSGVRNETSEIRHQTSEIRLVLPVASPFPAVKCPSAFKNNQSSINNHQSSDSSHIWNQYTLRVPGHGRRDALRKHLADHGISTEIYYPVPMHLQDCFAYTLKAQTSASELRTSNFEVRSSEICPVAQQLAAEVISIPIYPELTPEQRDEIVADIRGF